VSIRGSASGAVTLSFEPNIGKYVVHINKSKLRTENSRFYETITKRQALKFQSSVKIFCKILIRQNGHRLRTNLSAKHFDRISQTPSTHSSQQMNKYIFYIIIPQSAIHFYTSYFDTMIVLLYYSTT